MATCRNCQKVYGLQSPEPDLCRACYENPNQVQERNLRDQILRDNLEAIESVLLTTESAPNLNIIERIEIVTAEVAYGMNIKGLA